MSDKTNIVAYLDDATTSITYKPAGSENTPKAKSEFWRQNNNNVPLSLMGVITMSMQTLKDGTQRRMLKVTRPAAEVVATGGDAFGYVADPAVNYSCDPYIVVPVSPLASDTDVANSLRLLVSILLGDAAAGTANAYRDAADPAREFLVHGFMPD
jgi:hypothetical protein